MKTIEEFLKWDGSDITEHIINHPFEEQEENKIKYLKIEYNGSFIIGVRRFCKTGITSIVDEMKSFFNLPKNGTHQLRLSGKKYVLIRPTTQYINNKIYIQNYLTLQDIPPITDPIFIDKVKQILAFREIMGITKTFSSSIQILNGSNGSYPISYYEPGYSKNDQDRVIPETLIDEWFKDISLDNYIRQMLNITDIDSCNEKIMILRNQLNSVIERIDPSSIIYTDIVVSRLIRRL
jgi:hypothetical protein